MKLPHTPLTQFTETFYWQKFRKSSSVKTSSLILQPHPSVQKVLISCIQLNYLLFVHLYAAQKLNTKEVLIIPGIWETMFFSCAGTTAEHSEQTISEVAGLTLRFLLFTFFEDPQEKKKRQNENK